MTLESTFLTETQGYASIVKMGLMVIAVLACLYGYAVISTVGSVLHRSSLDKKIQTLTSEIATLEVGYLTHTESLTLARGESYGLREAKTVSFVEVRHGALSQQTNRDTHEL